MGVDGCVCDQQGLRIIVLHMAVQFFQHFLLKNPFFFSIAFLWYSCQKSIGRVCVGLFLDSPFCGIPRHGNSLDHPSLYPNAHLGGTEPTHLSPQVAPCGHRLRACPGCCTLPASQMAQRLGPALPGPPLQPKPSGGGR